MNVFFPDFIDLPGRFPNILASLDWFELARLHIYEYLTSSNPLKPENYGGYGVPFNDGDVNGIEIVDHGQTQPFQVDYGGVRRKANGGHDARPAVFATRFLTSITGLIFYTFDAFGVEKSNQDKTRPEKPVL